MTNDQRYGLHGSRINLTRNSCQESVLKEELRHVETLLYTKKTHRTETETSLNWRSSCFLTTYRVTIYLTCLIIYQFL